MNTAGLSFVSKGMEHFEHMVTSAEGMEQFEHMVTSATKIAFERMMRDPSRRIYLYFGRGVLVAGYAEIEHYGTLKIATPEPIPSNRDRAGVRAWIWEKARRLPCLPVE